MKKKILTLLLASTFLFSIPSSIFASENASDNTFNYINYEIISNGESINTDSFLMVPVRAVGESLGCTVTWNPDGTILLDNGEMHTNITVGKDLYTVTTSNKDLVGMSAPFSLGMPPVSVNGTVYVPISLFIPLYGNNSDIIKMDDNKIIINTENEKSGLPNPITNYNSIEELEKTVGFDISLPTMPENYEISSINDINKTLAEVVFSDGNNEITYRISKGNEDNSGDYNTYSDEKELKINDYTINCRGNDGINTATLLKDDFCISVTSKTALSENEISDIFKSIIF